MYKFKYRYLTLCIAAVFFPDDSSIAADSGVIDSGKGAYIINEGTVIKNNATSAVTGISSKNGDAYSVSGLGGVVIDISTSSGELMGISAVRDGSIDLGVGTQLTLSHTGQGGTYGINSGGLVKGKDLNVVVSTEGPSLGINVISNGTVVLSGDHNQVIVNSRDGKDATAIHAMGQSNTLALLSAENLHIETNGTGINAQNNSIINLAGSTVIHSTRGGIEAIGASYAPDTGGIVNAEKIHVITTGSNTGSAGLYALVNGHISAGAGSTVETNNMHGLYASSDPGYPTTPQSTSIEFIGSETERNTIRVNGLSGVTSLGRNATVNLANTDIKSTAKNADTVGLRALSGGVINARNISVISEDTGTSHKNIAAILSRNSEAKINLSGDSYIDASGTANRVAIQADGTGSSVSVVERAFIVGDVISKGNNTAVEMNLKDGSVFTGATRIVTEENGNTFSGGSIKLDLTESLWSMSDSSALTSLTLNGGGIINLNGNSGNTGNVLTVDNDYAGTGGIMVFNTVLESDNSATDKLIVKGDTRGTTFVRVNNAGGSGAQTLNGIELIEVGGKSEGEFIQDGRIVAGAYDYMLRRGQGAGSGNWYLTSGQSPSVPEPKPEPVENDIRPEAGSYTANLANANTLFITRLYERTGNTQYNAAQKDTRLWMRNEGGHNTWRDGSDQLRTQSNRYVLQMGGDLAQWSSNGNDRWHLGIMAGYGNSHSNTGSVRTGYHSKGSIKGYSVGAYATWYADAESLNGAYLDGQIQYSWFDNHVKGIGLQGESYESDGFTASLEAGYTQKNGEFTGSLGSLYGWYVQPQAQVVWMGVKADSLRERNGTLVDSDGNGSVQTRLGVKTWIQGSHKMDEGKYREFRPFVEMNWLHNTRKFSTRMDGVSVYQDGAQNLGEIKTGLEGRLSPNLNIKGNVGVQIGAQGYQDLSAMLNVKYSF